MQINPCANVNQYHNKALDDRCLAPTLQGNNKEIAARIPAPIAAIVNRFHLNSLNIPLAYKVLTYIWKRMGAERRGSGRSLAGARLKITMLFECHPQKRFMKLTFMSHNCKRTESDVIL